MFSRGFELVCALPSTPALYFFGTPRSVLVPVQTSHQLRQVMDRRSQSWQLNSGVALSLVVISDMFVIRKPQMSVREDAQWRSLMMCVFSFTLPIDAYGSEPLPARTGSVKLFQQIVGLSCLTMLLGGPWSSGEMYIVIPASQFAPSEMAISRWLIKNWLNT